MRRTHEGCLRYGQSTHDEYEQGLEQVSHSSART